MRSLEMLHNSPSRACSAKYVEHVPPFEPFGLGLEVIGNILFEILQSHDNSAYTA